MTWGGVQYAVKWTFGILVVAAALSAAAWVGYLSLADTSPPYVEYGVPYALDAKGTPQHLWRAGDTMYVHRSYCTTRVLVGMVHRSILNAEVRRLPSEPIPEPRSVGCSTITLPIEIPPNLSPGAYIYRAEFEHPINPVVGSIRYQLTDVPFTVMSNPVLDELITRYQMLDHRIKYNEARLKVLEQILKVPPSAPLPLPKPSAKEKRAQRAIGE